MSAKKKITVDDVKAVAEEIARADPDHVDPRAQAEGLVPHYLVNGKPACLVARVLTRLGFPTGVLKDLDRENPVGDIFNSGVKVTESRHPAMRKIDPVALTLLQYLQDQQDRGERWGRIVGDAFTVSRWRVWERRNKPWLHHGDDRRAA